MTNLTTPGEHHPVSRDLREDKPTPDVIFVDLDGTLINTDMLHEAVMAVFKKSPGLLLRLLLKSTGNRAAFKRSVSRVIALDIQQLPFRAEVIDFIRQQQLCGRKVILATASDSLWAQGIADHLGL